jgi:hypothetical protein
MGFLLLESDLATSYAVIFRARLIDQPLMF